MYTNYPPAYEHARSSLVRTTSGPSPPLTFEDTTMLGLPSIGLTKTLRDATNTVSTTLEATNRAANTINLACKLAESRMQYEVQKQDMIQAKRLEELQNAEVTKDASGNWSL